MEEEPMRGYKIEINRLYHQITTQNALEELDIKSNAYIDDIQFIKADAESKDMEEFFEEENMRIQIIKPWYEQDKLIGYLKFLYQQPQYQLHRLLWILESCLGILEISVLLILFYLKKKLIQPFQRLSKLPQELAKGHFQGAVEDEKSKYLGNFLWGMGQLKDNLEYSQKRQLELEKEKKQMLLSLSHDIKTPLNLIKLYSKAIEEQVYENEEDNLHAAHQIQAKSTEIEAYVEAIMKTSREDILDIHVEMEDFYLHDFVLAIQTNFQEICAIRKIDLKIGSYENRLIQGDFHKLREVIENLFDNAFKYGDGNRIEITFYEEDYCQLIRFFNTGKNIDDQDINHIFESFYRGKNSSGKQGSGLGLYICKEIMHKMDGEIFVQKETNGIAFIIVLR